MSSFTVSKSALADLKNIAIYTQKRWGAEQRKTYLKGLDLTFQFLAENPISGTPCDCIVTGLRKHHRESHCIYYANKNDGIFIIRVLHKSMDVELQFKQHNT
ncbi:type II toxin-antitoxin system RelE/ParE family toxin [Neptunicella sp. SCSIO 80796]|uniref:type II toxin-antitoxin system RelE/ParE family toxin n=1 Tax=Neptunicella plasticusilytica TaxID=3117012 RepID=UPI003A4D6D30